jgi:two-component system chemotaxis sensor kinase CheA
MNEFLEQFLLESRELVDQGTADLLALEKSPGDRERLDGAFRAFHTLKGGAGIVDFAVMAQALHGAEEALSDVRTGNRTITAALIGDCLACLDQVLQWLDLMEASGDLPKPGEADAGPIIARFARSADEAGIAPAPAPAPAAVMSDEGWAGRMLEANPALRARAKAAVRYTPDPHCFFEGVDPLALVAGLPGLLCLDVQPQSPWPPLDALDPFACNLVLTALVDCPLAEVMAALEKVVDECDVQGLAAAELTQGGTALSVQGREVLEAQIALTGESGAEGAVGRMASAGMVASNVLRNAGRLADADAITRAMETSLAASDPAVLRDAIEAVLGGTARRSSVSSSAAAGGPAPSAVATDPQNTARTLRIDVERIDALANLTGELTVAKNAIGHAVTLALESDAALGAMLKQRHAVLDRLVAELQQSVLGIRVLPMRHVFQRFPRLVRELSTSLGKQAALTIEGGETEADKAIVEMLFEPLLHVLRNALDHGIEDIATRSAQGKPPVATITLSAHREGEYVVVTVSDDGKGVDVARVRKVALERNVVSAETLAGMSNEEVTRIIFAPGFSTATEVTGVSGRGVGMDAVRVAIEKLSGRVAIESRAGRGTTVRFTLPFSVMMTRIMSVHAAGQAFGIPLDAVVETIRIGVDRISPVGAGHAIVLRNRTIPLVELAAVLGLPRNDSAETEATVVVAKVDGNFGALRVDRVGERMDIMLKPLEGLLAGMRGLAGSTVLGDGSVLLILDLGELFQ